MCVGVCVCVCVCVWGGGGGGGLKVVNVWHQLNNLFLKRKSFSNPYSTEHVLLFSNKVDVKNVRQIFNLHCPLPYPNILARKT